MSLRRSWSGCSRLASTNRQWRLRGQVWRWQACRVVVVIQSDPELTRFPGVGDRVYSHDESEGTLRGKQGRFAAQASGATRDFMNLNHAVYSTQPDGCGTSTVSHKV